MSTALTPSTARVASGNVGRVVRFLATRLALSLITLWLLSVIVFVGGQLLPGDVGRSILGPLADARAVAALNHQLGTDRPLLTQYVEWVTHFVRGDMGLSYAYREPVGPFIGDALAHSAKLGLLAFIVVVPLGIAGGVWAAMHAGRWIDRTISIAGLSATVVPEFVSSIALILIFGVWLRWLPIEATYPPGAGVLEQLKHLARAGTVEALDADYTRTAILKGLPQHVVIWRHVLRNALLPTITVAATQLGYMIGGLVVVETLFHYQGIGSLIYNAAKAKDFPMLEAGVLTIGVVYTVANLVADALQVLLNPRLRVRSGE
jgi:peptide/nickel transport system permease protein